MSAIAARISARISVTLHSHLHPHFSQFLLFLRFNFFIPDTLAEISKLPPDATHRATLDNNNNETSVFSACLPYEQQQGSSSCPSVGLRTQPSGFIQASGFFSHLQLEHVVLRNVNQGHLRFLRLTWEQEPL